MLLIFHFCSTVGSHHSCSCHERSPQGLFPQDDTGLNLVRNPCLYHISRGYVRPATKGGAYRCAPIPRRQWSAPLSAPSVFTTRLAKRARCSSASSQRGERNWLSAQAVANRSFALKTANVPVRVAHFFPPFIDVLVWRAGSRFHLPVRSGPRFTRSSA